MEKQRRQKADDADHEHEGAQRPFNFQESQLTLSIGFHRGQLNGMQTMILAYPTQGEGDALMEGKFLQLGLAALGPTCAKRWVSAARCLPFLSDGTGWLVLWSVPGGSGAS